MFDQMFNSELVEDYFLNLSANHLKQTLKMWIILFIYLHLFIVLYLSVYYYSSTGYLLFISGIFLTLLMLSYSALFCINSHNSLVKIGMFCILSELFNSIILFCDTDQFILTFYTPLLQIILLFFSFIQIKLTVSISITIFMISFLLFGSNHMIEISNIENKVSPASNFKNDMSRFNGYRYLLGQVLLWVATIIINCYLCFCNWNWRRDAFMTLGKNVQAKQASKQEMAGQMRWIEAVMPTVVKDEYWNKNADKRNDNDWIYIKQFDNVSILFADIVGFTNMSSNKTASQVVTLLNDLFNRFDDLCEMTKCEKLGTLGDCYYCVSGCPVARYDHAVCCVEMGLGMCNTIKDFNRDNLEDVNMRVGIHTGRVNAAIIGKVRFRFDVYSNDVLIANTIESSGKPGLVHISDTTYKLVNNTYNATKGQDLEIKREEYHGIAGMALKSEWIKTYFISPKESRSTQKSKGYKSHKDFVVVDINDESDQSGLDTDSEFDDFDAIEGLVEDRNVSGKNEFVKQMKDDITFVETLSKDPDQQINCFDNPPISPFTLRFTEIEIEWHYQNHTKEGGQNFGMLSTKKIALVETMISTMLTVLMFVVLFSFGILPENVTINSVLFPSVMLVTVFIIFMEYWKSRTTQDSTNNRFLSTLFAIASSHIYKTFVCLYLGILPSTVCLLLAYDCDKYSRDFYYQCSFFSVMLFSMVSASLYIAVLYPIKLLAIVVNLSLTINYVFKEICLDNFMDYRYQVRNLTCHTHSFIHNQMLSISVKSAIFLSQIMFTFIVIAVVVRERERNLRIWFYVTREAEIGREEALQHMYTSKKLLYNIIPRYVYEYINNKGAVDLGKGVFSYAMAIKNAGVVFACISNFFSRYYREDYKGGSNALKLLNQIIVRFDDLLSKIEFKDVEKIKTINDCYMLASGLNPDTVERNNDRTLHLRSLMKFALEMRRTLDVFNNNYIIGSDSFEIKIGYNIGSVTAGIIGSTKPMFDIWGDTVNVASRMYSTGNPGEIQVPYYVLVQLERYFEFQMRGVVFVKGKGSMNTYLCTKPVDPKSKFVRRRTQRMSISNMLRSTIRASMKI